MGIPVVVSDVRGLNETVQSQEYALMVKPGDTQSIASDVGEIIRLPKSPQLRESFSQEDLVNSRKYSVSKYIAQIEAFSRPKGFDDRH